MADRVTSLLESALVQSASKARASTLVMAVLRSTATTGSTPGANTPLLAWDRSATLRRPYVWRSRLKLNEYPTAYSIAQVRAADYASLTFRLYADGVKIYERVVTSEAAFTLPEIAANRTEIELLGTSQIQLVQIADDPEELV